MVSNHAPRDSRSTSRRSFLAAVGAVAATTTPLVASAAATSEDDVVAAIDEHAVPLAHDGEVPQNELVPAATRVAPPGTVGAAARTDERSAETVVAGRLAEHAVVGLGESTHGTHEFHALRRRIVQQLVEQHGVRVLAVEDDLSAVSQVNDYVVHGQGTIEAATGSIPLWVWRTAEFQRLLEWLREFNRGRPRSDRVEVHGVDAQVPGPSADALASYLERADPEGLAAVEDELRPLAERGIAVLLGDDGVRQDRVAAAREVVDALRTHLHERHSEQVAATSADEWTLALRYVRALEQSLDVVVASVASFWEGFERRDRYMAENTTWLLEERHTDRVVFWAHNAHVRRGTVFEDYRVQGDFLAETHGEDYYALASDFGTGSFTVQRSAGEFGAPTIDSPLAEVPALFSRSSHDECFVDFAAAADSALAEWIEPIRNLHDVGLGFDPDRPAAGYPLADSFDGFLFVERGTDTSVVGAPAPSGAAGRGYRCGAPAPANHPTACGD